MTYEDIEDSSGWNGYILLILSTGMPYYKGGYIAQALMCNQVLKYPPYKSSNQAKATNI